MWVAAHLLEQEDDKSIPSSASSNDGHKVEVYYGKVLEIWRVKFVLSDENDFTPATKCVALAKVQWQYGLMRDRINSGLFVGKHRRQKRGTTRDIRTTVEDASCISRTVAVFEHDKRMYVFDPEEQKLRHGSSCGVIGGLS